MAAADPEPLFRELVTLREKYAGLHKANVALGDVLEKQTEIIKELRLDRDKWQGIAERAISLGRLNAVSNAMRT